MMIIYLSFKHFLPSLVFNLFLLKYCYGMDPPHQPIHPTLKELNEQIELVEKTEQNFRQMLETVESCHLMRGLKNRAAGRSIGEKGSSLYYRVQ
uniref:Uncharacterized protein n=1 Tax=Meloidogyne hapla TaxID=6305 RepID=A0A1I8BQ65_MELHA